MLHTIRRSTPCLLAAALLLSACAGAAASDAELEVSGQARPLVQDVCLAYDDLRARDGVVLESDVQAIHARAEVVCDAVDDGRAEWEARQNDG